VVDGRWLSIGSMNMDRRSALCNTEMGLIVDSTELAGQVTSLLNEERLPRSYQLRIANDRRRLQWVAQQVPREVVLADEPSARWGRNLRLSLLASLVGEDLL
jgi:putative cardiolipin synthase